MSSVYFQNAKGFQNNSYSAVGGILELGNNLTDFSFQEQYANHMSTYQVS
jgi:hypothetical protein